MEASVLPEGFSPWTIRVIKGKGDSKLASDTCSCCFMEFTGKTAQESIEKLIDHYKTCAKTIAFNAAHPGLEHYTGRK